jgi:hypothetical protein
MWLSFRLTFSSLASSCSRLLCIYSIVLLAPGNSIGKFVDYTVSVRMKKIPVECRSTLQGVGLETGRFGSFCGNRYSKANIVPVLYTLS